MLRSELTHRLGVEWGPIVKGQAEIAGVPKDLLAVFSKRAAAIDDAMAVKLDDFRDREGREPSPKERAALEREASADTRGGKSGLGVADLATRWQGEAAAVGWTVERLVEHVQRAAADRSPTDSLTVSDVVEAVSAQHSSWGRPDVIQAICDVQRPVSQMSGHRWAAAIEHAADKVLERCVELDPPDATQRRDSDGRSLWIEPTAPRFTSQAVLVQEERILTWALDAQADPVSPSRTVERTGLDVLQTDAAASVAGDDRLVLVVGPAGAGKTRMLAAAVNDLHAHHRAVFGVAPTARAARVLEGETGMRADTVAKLLHEWQRSDRPPLSEYRLRAGATVVVDEAGMVSTPALHQLVSLAEAHRWRLVLVGDHRQLQAVGRGGLFAELCANGHVNELERLHRFTHPWEGRPGRCTVAKPAAASKDVERRSVPPTGEPPKYASRRHCIARRRPASGSVARDNAEYGRGISETLGVDSGRRSVDLRVGPPTSCRRQEVMLRDSRSLAHRAALTIWTDVCH